MFYTNVFKSEVSLVNKHNTTAYATGNLLCEKRTQNVYFDRRSHLIKILRYDFEVNIFTFFDILLTVHLNIFILILTNLVH